MLISCFPKFVMELFFGPHNIYLERTHVFQGILVVLSVPCNFAQFCCDFFTTIHDDKHQFPDTIESSYNMAIFLQNYHKRHSWVWGKINGLV